MVCPLSSVMSLAAWPSRKKKKTGLQSIHDEIDVGLVFAGRQQHLHTLRDAQNLGIARSPKNHSSTSPNGPKSRGFQGFPPSPVRWPVAMTPTQPGIAGTAGSRASHAPPGRRSTHFGGGCSYRNGGTKSEKPGGVKWGSDMRPQDHNLAAPRGAWGWGSSFPWFPMISHPPATLDLLYIWITRRTPPCSTNSWWESAW